MSTPYVNAAGVTLRDETRRSLDMYAQHGVSPGGFLQAALENDFLDAIGRASTESLKEISAVASYIYCALPSNCHGSREIVRKWANIKREDDAREDAAAVV